MGIVLEVVGTSAEGFDDAIKSVVDSALASGVVTSIAVKDERIDIKEGSPRYIVTLAMTISPEESPQQDIWIWIARLMGAGESPPPEGT